MVSAVLFEARVRECGVQGQGRHLRRSNLGIAFSCKGGNYSWVAKMRPRDAFVEVAACGVLGENRDHENVDVVCRL